VIEITARLNTTPTQKVSASKVIINLLIDVDPCYNDQLTSVMIADMHHTIEPSHFKQTQVVPPVLDSLLPLGIDCGLLRYVLTGTPFDDGWVEFDGETRTISLFPTSGFAVGTHEMVMFVDLANYPALTPKIGLEIAF